jgi:dephospho-CoA kinase
LTVSNTVRTLDKTPTQGGRMEIFVIVGMPASGKNIARVYAESAGIAYFATGDLVRQEVIRRGLEPTGINTAAVSTDLRDSDGLGVTRIALEAALESGLDVAFLEGMRSWPEIELISEKAKVTVIAFVAPIELRLKRVVERGRPDDSAAGFTIRDRREIDYGASVPIALADEYVLNTGTMDDALQELDKIMKRHC